MCLLPQIMNFDKIFYQECQIYESNNNNQCVITMESEILRKR